jgi:hypothetical protein
MILLLLICLATLTLILSLGVLARRTEKGELAMCEISLGQKILILNLLNGSNLNTGKWARYQRQMESVE